MSALDWAGRQVLEAVVLALYVFGLAGAFGPLDPFLHSLGVEPYPFGGLLAAAVAGSVVLLFRPLRMRLVVRAWALGLATTVVSTTLFVFFDLRGNPAGILLAWSLGVGLGLALAYPPLWRRAEARLRVE